ncbi:MAG TPA: DUF4238 domain-containing protein, partial [Polyangiaceae bacterium]
MSNPPKRHHVVPQFLLERFAKDGLVELVARDDLSRRITSPVPTALAQNHFYTTETDKGPNTEIETFFAEKVEGPASGALSKLIDGRRALSLPALRERISTLLAFQYVRGESTRRAIVENYRAMFQKLTLIMTP